jgi:GMP reductase
MKASEKQLLDYDDVVLIPNFSTCNSRTELEIKIPLGDMTFKSPAIPSNMICAIDYAKAEELANLDYFYVLHRFYPYDDVFKWAINRVAKYNSLSIGVQEKDYEFVKRLSNARVDVEYITIDIAHGHHQSVKDMIAHVRNELPATFIIAGNVGTAKGTMFLQNCGANAIKVGLGYGKACTTYNCTGVGTPMFSTIREITFSDVRPGLRIPIIADGGVRQPGDICKALVAGANFVMIGSEFAACSDSPGEIVIDEHGVEHKEYFGSASEYTKGHKAFVEGRKLMLESKHETYLQYISRVNQGVKSCMSYAGVDDVNKLFLKMDYREKK